VQFVVQELDVCGDVFIVKFALLQNAQLLQNLALHHGDAVFLGNGWFLGLFNQVLQKKLYYSRLP